MSEQWYVLSYDISQAKRLKRLHYAIKKEATALQHSVFLLQADHKKLIRIKKLIKKHTHTQQDDVRLYPLKHPDSLWIAGIQQQSLDNLYLANTSSKPRKTGVLRLLTGFFKRT